MPYYVARNENHQFVSVYSASELYMHRRENTNIDCTILAGPFRNYDEAESTRVRMGA